MTWKPERATDDLEELMERSALPEQDREELRRFSEFLRRKKVKKEDRSPLTAQMKDWLLGKDRT